MGVYCNPCGISLALMENKNAHCLEYCSDSKKELSQCKSVIIIPRREDTIRLVFTVMYQTPDVIRGSPHGQMVFLVSRPVIIFINFITIVIPNTYTGPVLSI